jgi:hypothetical protein
MLSQTVKVNQMTKLVKATALMCAALLLIVFKINVLPTTLKEFMKVESADARSKNTPRSDRLFKAYDQAAYRLAQKIERGEPISLGEQCAWQRGTKCTLWARNHLVVSCDVST